LTIRLSSIRAQTDKVIDSTSPIGAIAYYSVAIVGTACLHPLFVGQVCVAKTKSCKMARSRTSQRSTQVAKARHMNCSRACGAYDLYVHEQRSPARATATLDGEHSDLPTDPGRHRRCYLTAANSSKPARSAGSCVHSCRSGSRSEVS
jgi:hypothetical protein